ncbi:hypothetical protein B0H63DRAFT_459577 [Podospora didyma]|uniref:Uncharacterized protein n=1 Tax=Podospora didyma TaxID=330526 RepID=A0AAE0P5Y6_9PEZI|nr:hypothetical protein B0H63DRAFT_459577 [Podospora didyma]
MSSSTLCDGAAPKDTACSTDESQSGPDLGPTKDDSITALAGQTLVLASRVEEMVLGSKNEAEYWKAKHSELAKAYSEQLSKIWELEDERQDLKEEVDTLRAQLRSSIFLGDRGNYWLKPRTALEAYQEDKIQKLEKQVEELKRGLQVGDDAQKRLGNKTGA